jgi:DNA-3-methyladenine glycosylase
LVRESAGGVRIARIVEVEAYSGVDDRASHARFGRTKRNAVMFGPAGHAYVYLVYGMYDCLNVVTEPEGRPAALLVRAVQPLRGADLMRRGREMWVERAGGRGDRAGLARARQRVAALPDEALAAGPGLVCVALSIDRDQSGLDLCDPASALRLEAAPPDEPPLTTARGPRIGIGHAAEPWRSKPWRVWAVGNGSVSGRTGRR